MRTIRWRLRTGITRRTAAMCIAMATTPPVTQITIDDRLITLGHSAEAHWEITPRGQGYWLQGKATDEFGRKTTAELNQAVPTPAVDAVIAALRAPARPLVEPADVYVDEARAQAVLDGMAAELSRRATTDDLRKRIQAWRDDLRQPAVFRKALTGVIGGGGIPDFDPTITVTARFKDGSHVSFETRTAYNPMLPWEINGTTPSYDPALTRALATVLPAQSPNKPYTDDGLVKHPEGEGAVKQAVSESYDTLDAETWAPRATAALRSRLDVVQLRSRSRNGDPMLEATIRLPGMPANLVMIGRVTLDTLRDGQYPPGVLDEMQRQLRVVAKASALAARARRDPTGEYHVRFDRLSFPRPTDSDAEEARRRQLFIDQMHASGKLKDLTAVSPAVAGAVMVTDADSIVFAALADGRTVLWQDRTGMLPGKHCADWVDVHPQDGTDIPTCPATVLDNGRPSPKVKRIRIHDQWMGMREGAPFDVTWTIEPGRDGYRLRGQGTVASPNHLAVGNAARTIGPLDIAVPEEAVEALRAAMLAPPNDEVDLAALRVDMAKVQAWLDKEAARLGKELPAPAQKARIAAWRDSLRDGATVGKAVAYGLSHDFHTDDYPSLDVELVLTDGTTRIARSTSQNAMMLPWMDENHAAHYDPAWSRALDALLPASSPSADRLTQASIDDQIEDLMETGTAPQTGRIVADAKVPLATRALTERFTLNEIRVIPVDHFVDAVVADLGYQGMPSNLHMQFNVELQMDGEIPGWILAEAERQWKMMAASPGLINVSKASPNDIFFFDLSVRSDGSIKPSAPLMFADGTRKRFISEMHARGRLLDMSAESPLLVRAVEVDQLPSGARWMVLPDHRVFASGEAAGLPPGLDRP